MPSSKLILVTGASGFIGAHVVVQLLAAGYRVRGTARGAKTDLLKAAFGSYPNFEVAPLDDVATGDFTAVLQGVDAIIHLASPLAGRQSAEDGLNTAIQGTLNILQQALKAGVSKVVLTSSWATTLDPNLMAAYGGVTFTEKDWGKTSKEELLNPELNPVSVYCGSKLLAERAAWDFAREHPELDLATINPPFVYGPPVPGISSGSGIMSLGTNALIYQLVAGESGRPLPLQLPPFYCHVQDVARAHVLALEVPKVPSGKDVEERRFIVAGPGALLNDEAVKILQAERPALKDRLPTLENAPALPGPLSTIDTTRAKEVLGLKAYKGAKDTLLETVDALLEVEKTW
ncbi:NAD-P-binding protein [Lentinus tigrinus ALCF2SS1-7]|uniref:NAD-P-binding protein n=1 Tax=Lentinus tigrinus ALCF2SS1-6 TaxID=1328759 RepID=A0A5C2RMX3_9APHY|nr:NAD-P-binding protein [Lentinus tigrinus ALCF2SS1-6]RPD73205.1 NAD-P-binding protein [Lentinus tigrinus ALCF2SS1-7]